MNTNPSKVLAFQFAAFLAGTASVIAQGPEERGLEIATEADRRDTGFGDSTSRLEMLLSNSHGETSGREMSLKTLEVDGDGDKTLIYFDRPRDVKGTAFLSYTHKSGPDDQWIFLPALERVKRINSKNKSGPFVGSEFAYEDLSSQEVEKYTYKYLRDEALNGMDCFVVERYPVDPLSGYTRQVLWLDKDEYRSQRLDFYDRKDELLKTLTFQGYEQYLERFWRAAQMEMVNHQTGKRTALNWKDYTFGNGFEDRDFDRRSLEKAR